jgi:hypothetical protein
MKEGGLDRRVTLVVNLRTTHERGRHRGIQAKERICKLCLKEVEDEIHFLLKCEALQNVRTPFIDLINNNNYNFKHLD